MKPTETEVMSVKHIELNQQGEAVKRFFQSLPSNGEPSVIELNGHAVARVLPVSDKKTQDKSPKEWSEEKNARRCDLIDQEIAGNLSAEEAKELEQLQQQMLAYRDKVAPWPIEDARRLHQELLRKAAAANKSK